MDNYDQLSKEELIKLVKAKLGPSKTDPQQIEEDNQCKYIPTRGDRKRCEKYISTPYGFCSTHKNTVQAKKAKELYDIENKTENPPKESTETPPVAPSVSPQEVPVEIKEETITEETKKVKSDVTSKDTKDTNDTKDPKETSEQTSNVSSKEKDVKRRHSQSRNRDSSHKTHSLKKRYSGGYTPKNSPENKYKTTTVQMNNFGHFEHKPTHIVFNPKSLRACGIQLKNGVVRALKDKEIKICESNGWNYEVLDDEDSDVESDDNSDVESVYSDEEGEVLDGEKI